MSTLVEVYQQLCNEDRFPSSDVTDPEKRDKRRNDLRTALRYLAESHGSTADTLPLTPAVEVTYKARLKEYLVGQGKGPSTIRNTIQSVGQFIRAYRHLPSRMIIPQAPGWSNKWREATRGIRQTSPYRHQAWMGRSKYYLPMEQWPEEVTREFERFKDLGRDTRRPVTLNMDRAGLEAYLGYLSMDGPQRLDRLPPEARRKLEGNKKRFGDDLKSILQTPQTVAWDDLFVLNHLRSFVIWHSWRAHKAEDAAVEDRDPGKTTRAEMTGRTVLRLANALGREQDAKPILTYMRHLPKPRRVHDKQAACHQFSPAELEEVAKTLMNEARAMDRTHTAKYQGYTGGYAAARFSYGLVLMLGWRIPIRARNWCEALLNFNDPSQGNLRKVNGAWHWHFEGEELKVGKRNGDINKFDIEIPPDVTPFLEEYLTVWRPKLPGADTDRHVLLNAKAGGPRARKVARLWRDLQVHVYRLTGKRLYTHLLRTIFYSTAVREGLDLSTAANYIGDNVLTANRYYHEFQPESHKHKAQDFYRKVLGNGHGVHAREGER